MLFIIVSIVAVVISTDFYTTIYKNSISDHLRINKQIAANIDEKIIEIENHYDFLISNKLIFKSLLDIEFGTTSQSYEAVVYLKELMFSLISTTNGLHSLFYLSKDQTIVSSLSGVLYPEFLREESFFNNPVVKNILSGSHENEWYVGDIEKSGYVYYLRGVKNPKNGEVLGIVSFVIQKEMFLNNQSKLAHLQLSDQEGTSILNMQIENIPSELIKSFSESDQDSNILEINKKFYIGSKCENSWFVITEIDKGQLVDGMGILFKGVITGLLGILFSGIIIIFIINRYVADLSGLVEAMKNSKPGDLREIDLECRSYESYSVVTGYNEMIRNINSLNKNLSNEIELKLRAEKKTLYLQDLWENMFENSSEGIVITNSKGEVERVNKRFSKITGYSFNEVKGQSTNILKSDRHDKKFYEEMWGSLIRKGKWSGEVWNRRKSGEAYPEWLGITSFTEQGTGRLMYFAVFHDISDSKMQEEKLQWMTNYDALTNLPQRPLFLDKMKDEFHVAERKGDSCAFIVMNIDGLKNVNSSLGVKAGDKVLQKVGEILRATTREKNNISRFGGDEFGILIPRLEKSDDIYPVMKRLQSNIRQPMKIHNQIVELTASFGVAIYPDDAQTVQDMMTKAGLALERTKSNRKGSFSIFDSELDAQLIANSQLEMKLRSAIKNGALELHYQPKVNAEKQKVIGFEALLRWHHSEEGWIPPFRFIPVAEESGMIVEIGYFVIDQACDFLNKLRSEGYDELHVGVNISARQLAEPNFIDNLISRIDDKGITPAMMDLEITESITASEVYNAIESLERLSKAGFNISIDDFGTGYSSLKYLISLPFDTIKIDKSFIDVILLENGSDTVLKAMISLAHSLGKKLIAEGVETQKQVTYLLKESCPIIQGYFYSKPLDETDVLAFLADETHLSRT